MSEPYATEMTKFPILQGFTLAGAEMLIECGEIAPYGAGEILFKEGDEPSFAVLVLSGSLQVFLQRGEREITLSEPGPGTILGELGILCSFPRSASVRAKSDCVVLRWRAMEFRRLLLRHSLFSDRVLGQSLRNLIEKERSLLDSPTGEQAVQNP